MSCNREDGIPAKSKCCCGVWGKIPGHKSSVIIAWENQGGVDRTPWQGGHPSSCWGSHRVLRDKGKRWGSAIFPMPGTDDPILWSRNKILTLGTRRLAWKPANARHLGSVTVGIVVDLNFWFLSPPRLSPVTLLPILVLVLDKYEAVLCTKHQPALVTAWHKTWTEPIRSGGQCDHRHNFGLSGKL